MNRQGQETWIEEHAWRNTYFSDKGHNILEEFLVPVLRRAANYDRITGDFASAFLRAGALGFSSFFARGGTMRLVTNGRFNEADVEALEAGHDLEAVAATAIERDVAAAVSDASAYEENHLKVFTWLLQTGRLRIKVAIVPDAAGNPRTAGAEGDFHNKVGIVNMPTGETVGFLGGLNESMRAYTRNSESIACRYSWKAHHQDELNEWQDFFETVWSNQAVRSKVFDFPEAAARALISTYNLQEPPNVPPPVNQKPSAPNLWRHQDEAASRFLDAKRGILEMATGTGKTRTALRIARQLWEEERIEAVVVATRGNDLLDQWYGEFIKQLGVGATQIYRTYGPHKEGLLFANQEAERPVLITSLDNLRRALHQDKRGVAGRSLLIIDEVHNLGAAGLRNALDGYAGRIGFVLGLSATPERAYDETGNQFVDDFVGPTVYHFGLSDAIKRGILCEFDYDPLAYSFTDEDAERLQAVYAAQSAASKHGTPWTQEELWTRLANIRKTARGKLAPFAAYLAENPGALERSIVFVEDMEYGELVQEIVIQHTYDYHTYYGDDDVDNLRLFAKGDLSCLITCKKLSEGIDIRSVRSIILFASDRGRLATTQRIGRALRTNPMEPNKRALVVDFLRDEDLVATPAPGEPAPADADRRDWLEELSCTRRSE